MRGANRAVLGDGAGSGRGRGSGRPAPPRPARLRRRQRHNVSDLRERREEGEKGERERVQQETGHWPGAAPCGGEGGAEGPRCSTPTLPGHSYTQYRYSTSTSSLGYCYTLHLDYTHTSSRYGYHSGTHRYIQTLHYIMHHHTTARLTK